MIFLSSSGCPIVLSHIIEIHYGECNQPFFNATCNMQHEIWKYYIKQILVMTDYRLPMSLGIGRPWVGWQRAKG